MDILFAPDDICAEFGVGCKATPLGLLKREFVGEVLAHPDRR